MIKVEVLSGNVTETLQVDCNNVVEGVMPNYLNELYRTSGALAQKISWEEFLRNHADSYSNKISMEKGNGIKVSEVVDKKPAAKTSTKGKDEKPAKVESDKPEVGQVS